MTVSDTSKLLMAWTPSGVTWEYDSVRIVIFLSDDDSLDIAGSKIDKQLLGASRLTDWRRAQAGSACAMSWILLSSEVTFADA